MTMDQGEPIPEAARELPAEYLNRCRATGIWPDLEGTVSKSDLAALEGVSQAAVSKWLNGDKISDAAMRGSGRRARIHLLTALNDLRGGQNINHTSVQRKSDAAQSIAFVDPATAQGNSATPLTAPVPAQANELPFVSDNEDTGDSGDDALDASKETKVRMIDARMRRAVSEAILAEQKVAKETGQWIHVKEHETVVLKITGELISLLEALGPALTEKLCGVFEGPTAQEVSNLVTEVIRHHRQTFAEQAQKRADEARRERNGEGQ